MVMNITINETFSIHDLVKNYSCHKFLTKRNINTFCVLIFIQMRTDENKWVRTGKKGF